MTGVFRRAHGSSKMSPPSGISETARCDIMYVSLLIYGISDYHVAALIVGFMQVAISQYV